MTNSTNKTLELIFIDDNQLLTKAWELAAKSQGKHIKTFNTINDMLQFIPNCPKEIPIYIDNDLRANISGIELAKQLYEQGFRTIYLATGYDKSYFNEEFSWITGIVGKEIPF